LTILPPSHARTRRLAGVSRRFAHEMLVAVVSRFSLTWNSANASDPALERLTVTQSSLPGRRAVSLLQCVLLLVVSGLGVGLLLPALRHARDDGNRLTCMNNLRQLALATQKFEATNGTLPPYWGSYPTQDTLSIKGGWFCHLLPYVGETAFYGEIMADIQKTGVNWDVMPDSRQLPETGPSDHDKQLDSRDSMAHEMARFNGHSHWEWKIALEDVPIPPKTLSGSDPIPKTSQKSAITRKGNEGPGGIFRPAFSSKVFPLLQCPSDPSPATYPDAGQGQVYLTREQAWGSTNYLANWHAFANNNMQSGFLTPPQKSATIIDGLANTVMFSEAYSWCDGKGRLALNSWDYHSFGLTWSLGNACVDDGAGKRNVDFPRGMPNTYLFQIQPLPKETPDCPDGVDCCNNWRAQTGHNSLSAAMADGSVREFARNTTQRVWDHALLPRDGDGLVPGLDW
jgi:hypothetical protein